MAEVAAGREYRTLVPKSASEVGNFTSLAISPEGGLVAAATGEGVALWDVHTGQHLHFLPLGGSRSALFDASEAWLDGLRGGP